MEWAQAFIVDSCFSKVDVIGYDIYDICAVEYLVYCLIANHILRVFNLSAKIVFAERFGKYKKNSFLSS